MGFHTIDKSFLDDLLKLFVVLYLKSSIAVKLAFADDLENIFMLIEKSKMVVLFEQNFKFHIFFYRICQFMHCYE